MVKEINVVLNGIFLLKVLLKVVKNPIFVILHNLQDPYNLGSAIRTADSAGATALIVTGENTCGIHSRVCTYSCGAIKKLPTIHIKSIKTVLHFLRENRIIVYGTVLDSYEILYKRDFTGGIACIFGTEGSGLNSVVKKYCDVLLSIPMLGHTNSINVSCSISVFLYEIIRQRFFSS